MDMTTQDRHALLNAVEAWVKKENPNIKGE